MKVELAVFTILFLLQGFLYFRIKNTMKKRVLFIEVYENFIKLYCRYIELCYNEKILKKSKVNYFLKEKFKTLNILEKCTSFKDIVSVTNHKKKILNESEIEKLILEIDNSSDEIKELFNDLLTVDIKLFKSIRVKFKNGVLISGNIYFYIFKIKFILKVLLEILNDRKRKEDMRKAKEETAIRLYNRKNPIGICGA
ncbi:hypothetical protein HUW76_07910 [Fusobacterium animalis]|jgi:hypothetical protein|uniref:Uncharacterized protein n=1 Tax=Fusobacterium animalis 4_8 TaxID=469607 RepID=R9RDM4_9FUSO|nr:MULTISPECIES: hypothetical protein [Fusobacterium]AGM24022.1 hypothetical protein HMPREF0409_00156 [Fusobacterium animalis 4_8]EEW94075.1 hypothetical protein HMPREF0406_01971 [Fusobacterium animalis 3_1_33]MCG6845338.1 hypothetical protein [Fusobacterium nucleatum]OFL27774.1 hypothetical protein HMPREF2775_09820 [Fusobacterium sp. HMSC064B12]